MAEELLRATRANDGLAPVDLERFWADQAVAAADPFGAHIPQVALGIATMSGECVYGELGVAEDYRRYAHDEPWRLDLHRAYNDRAERIVGRRLLPEQAGDPTRQWPSPGTLADVFEAKNVWHDWSWWLQQAARTPDELKALLDRVDRKDIRRVILPAGWEEAKARLRPLGIQPPLYRGQRGPVTFAASIYGAENLIFLILDQPDLAARLRDTILRVMLEIARILDEEAGYTPETAPRGFGFADDNCVLLTPDMYEFFGFPVLQGMFARYCPAPGDWRYQHSDSAMAHLLPVLARLNFSQVNFGPTVTCAEIRAHMPRTIIQGQLAPFTFSRNEQANLVLEFLRDHAMTRDTRGLLFATAGSINNGSRLAGLRLIMAAIQRYGRLG